MRRFSEFVFRWFHDRAMLWVCAVEVLSPIVHEPPPLEQVRRRVGRLDPVADDVSEHRLDHLTRVVRLLAAESRKLDRKP